MASRTAARGRASSNITETRSSSSPPARRYAVELFAAVCLGATCGYALLNLDDEPAASTDPCCQAQCPAMEVKVVPDGSATAELPTRDVAPADVELPACCGGAAAALEETKREDAV